MMPAPSTMPFAPVWDGRCRVLILGSHPSVRSKQEGFYYMHPHNRFWPMLSAVLEEPLVGLAPEAKAEALLRHHVALYDVVSDCVIEGSADASMREVRPADLVPLLDSAPIGHVLLNGKTAYRLFCLHFPRYASIAHCMPSTSPANARMRLSDLVREWRILEDML